MPENARCSTGGDRTICVSDTSTTPVSTTISNSEEKTSVVFFERKTACRYFRATREARRQHLHLHLQLQLQIRSARLRNGKRVGVHGNLHHLRNVYS